MSIIFDEVKYAENIETEDINTLYDAIKKGTLLAKLYIKRGLTDDEILRLLNQKFYILDSSYNYNIKYLKIKKMIEQAKRNPNMESRPIYFSKEEMDFVHSINNIDIEKVLFIMLCISKFYKNSFYFKDREILSLANISWGGQKSQKIFQYLIQHKYFCVEEKMIQNSKHVRELFYCPTERILNLYNDKNIVLEIIDYRNLIYYYLQYFKIGCYIYCKNCNCIEEKKSNSQIYCKICSNNIKFNQKKEWDKNHKLINPKDRNA